MNTKNFQYEDNIDLKEVTYKFFYKWRIALIATVLGFLLFGLIDLIVQLKAEPYEVTDVLTGVVTVVVPEFSILRLIARFFIGGILGSFSIFVCVLVKEFCVFFWGSKLQNVSDICYQLGIPIVANFYVPIGANKRKKLNKIDKWFNKLEGADRVVDSDMTFELAEAKLNVLSTSKKVMIVGAVAPSQLKSVEYQLNSFRTSNSPEYFIAEDIMTNKNAILKLKECDVLLVQEEKKSDEKATVAILEFLTQSRVNIAGAIVL